MFNKFAEKFSVVLVITLVTLSMISLFSSGNITRYYFQNSTSRNEVQTYCIYGNIPWRLDPVIGCSASVGEAIMLTIALNGQNIKVEQVSPDSVVQPKPLKEEKF